MDSGSSDNEDIEQRQLDVHGPRLHRIDHVRGLGRPDLQEFVLLSPGNGMALVYVFVNVLDAKVYVGKHAHCKTGKSLWQSRIQKHLSPSPRVFTYWANAMRCHGKEAFEYYVIWHGPESEVDEQERFWIGPDGLHAIKDYGGWGYNAKEGGEGGALAPSSILKIKEFQNTPAMTALKSKTMSNLWRNDRNRMLELLRSSVTPERRAEMSTRMKKYWEEAPEERRDEIIRRGKTIEHRETSTKNALKRESLKREQRDADLEVASDSQRADVLFRRGVDARQHQAKKELIGLLRAIPGHEFDTLVDIKNAIASNLIPRKAPCQLEWQKTQKSMRIKALDQYDPKKKASALKLMKRNQRANARRKELLQRLRRIEGYERATPKMLTDALQAGVLSRW